MAERILGKVKVGISNRHVHLSKGDLEKLFGEGYQLTNIKDLSQPGQFAADETVTLVGPKGVLQRVRVLGPTRANTQVEISRTDAFALGVKPPVRDSGQHEGSAGQVTVVGPQGAITLSKGVILAKRHVHMTPADATRFGVKDKDIVKIRCGGDRGLIFDQVLVRVGESFALDCHLDTDEANAAMLNNGDEVEVLK
ncbi:MAG: phosphate propanoyltransferase [Firmicutes bacterium]|jgi:putative phosphotransacetylase|nr:phosphate propanoyltransferase [Bacillota bacterium]